MDRIDHDGIEAFKTRVLGLEVCGKSVLDWSRLLPGGPEDEIKQELRDHLGIEDLDEQTVVDPVE